MKKTLFFVIVFFLFFACDDIPDDIVESLNPSYQVVSLNLPDNLEYVDSEVELDVSVEFEDVSTISSVWFDIVDEDGSSEIKSNIELTIGDDNYTYSGQTILDSSIAEGKYYIEIYVEDNQRNSAENVHQIASHAFQFNSSVGNYAPVLNNLVIADSVTRGVEFRFSVEVFDSNGIADVDSVYYEVYNPNGVQLINSENISKFPLSDNGDTEKSGDAEADDGIYTMLLTIPGSYPSGNWKFVFTAVDNKGAQSNQLIHTLTVR